MGFFLLDNPPKTRQFHPARVSTLSGVVVLHTTESPAGSPARNVAAFISRRDTPGSYHEIVDATETVQLIPDSYTAFSVATSGFNSHTWNIAIAARTTDLDPMSDWTIKVIDRLAERIIAFWERNGFTPLARLLSASEAAARVVGITHHGILQSDRSDAWVRHPQLDSLNTMLFAGILKRVRPVTGTSGDQDVNPTYICYHETEHAYYTLFGNHVSHINNETELKFLIDLAAWEAALAQQERRRPTLIDYGQKPCGKIIDAFRP
jgi:hypothetical protein